MAEVANTNELSRHWHPSCRGAIGAWLAVVSRALGAPPLPPPGTKQHPNPCLMLQSAEHKEKRSQVNATAPTQNFHWTRSGAPSLVRSVTMSVPSE